MLSRDLTQIEQYLIDCQSNLVIALVLHWLALLCFVIGQKISCSFINQSEVKPKPILTCLHTFSRAWFIGLSASVVIGQSDFYSFGFKTLG